MSGTPYTPVAREDRGTFDYDYDDTQGQGLVTFAGVMLMIAAVLNVLYGIAAIDKANFFTHNARYVFGNLNTWGWFLVAFGVLQFFAALAIWRGRLVGQVVRRRAARASTRSCRRCGSRPIPSWR